jgi:hypothetical protein
MFSCAPENKENTDSSLPGFRDYLKKFTIRELPLTFTLDEIYEEAFALTITDSLDTFYTKENSRIYGMLSDTSNFFGLITVSNDGPLLTTFDMTGKIIDSEKLSVEECPSDPCIVYWNETCIIKKDMSFYIADSIKSESGKSDGMINCNNQHYYVFRDGKISNEGKISISEVKKTIISE